MDNIAIYGGVGWADQICTSYNTPVSIQDECFYENVLYWRLKKEGALMTDKYQRFILIFMSGAVHPLLQQNIYVKMLNSPSYQSLSLSWIDWLNL